MASTKEAKTATKRTPHSQAKAALAKSVPAKKTAAKKTAAKKTATASKTAVKKTGVKKVTANRRPAHQAHADGRARLVAAGTARRRGATAETEAAEIGAAVATILLEVAPGETRRFVNVFSGTGSDSLDPDVWGAAPSRADISAGLLANLSRQFTRRSAVAAESVSRAQAAKLLKVSDQTVTDYLASSRLVGLKQGRRWLIPAWQLDADAVSGMLPGVDRLAAAFPGGVVAMTRWVTAPSPQLDGRTPRDALAAGHTDDVVRVAGQLTAAGW